LSHELPRTARELGDGHLGLWIVVCEHVGPGERTWIYGGHLISLKQHDDPVPGNRRIRIELRRPSSSCDDRVIDRVVHGDTLVEVVR
jgi:hypothetical protein